MGNEESLGLERRCGCEEVISLVLIDLARYKASANVGLIGVASDPDSAPGTWARTAGFAHALSLWLLVWPERLSHDWGMGSVPPVTEMEDARNAATRHAQWGFMFR